MPGLRRLVRSPGARRSMTAFMRAYDSGNWPPCFSSCSTKKRRSCSARRRSAREPCDDPVEGRNRSGEPQREPWTPRSASSLIGENWGVAGPSGVVGRRHTSPASSSSSESGGGPHAMSNRWRASGPYDESEVAPP